MLIRRFPLYLLFFIVQYFLRTLISIISTFNFNHSFGFLIKSKLSIADHKKTKYAIFELYLTIINRLNKI